MVVVGRAVGVEQIEQACGDAALLHAPLRWSRALLEARAPARVVARLVRAVVQGSESAG